MSKKLEERSKDALNNPKKFKKIQNFRKNQTTWKGSKIAEKCQETGKELKLPKNAESWKKYPSTTAFSFMSLNSHFYTTSKAWAKMLQNLSHTASGM